jgi:hypothetical protein
MRSLIGIRCGEAGRYRRGYRGKEGMREGKEKG